MSPNYGYTWKNDWFINFITNIYTNPSDTVYGEEIARKFQKKNFITNNIIIFHSIKHLKYLITSLWLSPWVYERVPSGCISISIMLWEWNCVRVRMSWTNCTRYHYRNYIVYVRLCLYLCMKNVMVEKTIVHFLAITLIAQKWSCKFYEIHQLHKKGKLMAALICRLEFNLFWD